MSNFKLGPNQEHWLEQAPKYEKIKGALYVPNKGFCWLGVAAEEFSPEPWLTQVSGEAYYFCDGEEHSADLDEETVEKLGLLDARGRFKTPLWVKDKVYFSLMAVNDSGLFETHAEMAEWVRENAEDIFERSA